MKPTLKTAAVVGGIAVLAYLLFRARAVGAVTPAEATENAFQAPYFQNVPGVSPTQMPGFVSNVSVTVNPDLIGMLDHQYMPLFGFVGIGIAGGMPDAPQPASVQITPPPPPAINFGQPIPAPPPVASWASTGTRGGLRDGYYDLTGASPRGLTSNLRTGGSGTSGTVYKYG